MAELNTIVPVVIYLSLSFLAALWESEVFWDCFRAHRAARKDKDR